MPWTGATVHLMETGDEDRPHWLTQVTTAMAPATAGAHLLPIQEALAPRARLPAQHLVDAGAVRAGNVIHSRPKHQLVRVGPSTPATSGRRASWAAW
jgi:transposase